MKRAHVGHWIAGFAVASAVFVSGPASAATISTVAGGGAGPGIGDGGPATGAVFTWPNGLAIDSKGNLFVADPTDNRVRKVDGATGIITTAAGTGIGGFSGDGGLATLARISRVYQVALDASDNLFIADHDSGRIRMVDAVTGNITTVMPRWIARLIAG